MTTILTIILAVLSNLLLLSCTSNDSTDIKEESDRPNIVYILSDTHRWGAMSFTQTPGVETPNLDSLAQQGISFNRAYANHPLCTPYRAILMTGRWPYQQGLIANHMNLNERVDLPESERTRGTIGWVFKNAGYTTAHIGKWHLGGEDGRPFGFDKSILWENTNNHRQSMYFVDGGPAVDWKGLSNATATTDQALRWIETVREGPKPFFIIISLNPPHGPFHDAPEEKKALYPNESTLPFHPLDQIHDWESHRDYHALVSGMDDEVGRITNRLDELGLSENTLLVYTSDHGGMSGLNGIKNYGQKRNPNDESTRVPFMARWTGKIPPGAETDVLFSTIDVFPTLAGLADLQPHLRIAGSLEAETSLTYLESLPGLDLSSTFLGRPGGPEPESVFLMHPSNMNNLYSLPQPIWRAIVTPRYTYAVTEDAEFALWENSEDYQRTNRVAAPETFEIRRKLWSELGRWMGKAETAFVDNWFAGAARSEIQAWNREHGLGEENNDRAAGKEALFDVTKSKPRSP